MCLAEVHEGAPTVMPGHETLAAGGPALFPGVAAGAERGQAGEARREELRLTWFGTNGWKLEFRAGNADRTILIDPFLARFSTGFLENRFDPQTPLQPADPALVERHVPAAVDQILVGHGHWDHLADVPAVWRRTGAMVIGSETHWHLLRGFGVPDESLVVAQGGEVMAFDGYSIEVFGGLHSMGATKKFALPGHLLADPPMPTVVGELPEGDSLCYLLTIDGGSSVFLMSSANFVERNLTGIRPDVALIAGLFRNEIRDYTERLLRTLDYPGVLLPTHWDNFERPYEDGATDLSDILGEPGALDTFVAELKRVSPASRVVVLDFFETFGS
jgi:L-ascorbate metabolism protein UlaG (beta-lactamase superfamily)